MTKVKLKPGDTVRVVGSHGVPKKVNSTEELEVTVSNDGCETTTGLDVKGLTEKGNS